MHYPNSITPSAYTLTIGRTYFCINFSLNLQTIFSLTMWIMYITLVNYCLIWISCIIIQTTWEPTYVSRTHGPSGPWPKFPNPKLALLIITCIFIFFNDIHTIIFTSYLGQKLNLSSSWKILCSRSTISVIFVSK